VLASAAGAGLSLALAACSEDGDSAPPVSEPTAASGQPTAPAPVAPSSLRWQQIASANAAPMARKDHALAYDAEAGIVYLFGGRAAGAPLNDLWRFQLDTRQWTRLEAAGGPPARFGHNTAFDPVRHQLVVFGGQAGATFFDDVWGYTASQGWVRLGNMTGPSARYGAGGALDPASGSFYVTHGFTSQGRFDDTWRFALAQPGWSNASPSGAKPLARCLLRAVWDGSEQALLLFGGQSNSSPFHNDFWRLTPGGQWTEVRADPRPSARNLYAADYDGAANRLLLFGGRTQAGNADDLWSFSNGAWSRLDAGSGPAARNSHDAVYLPDRQALAVFGGSTDQGEQNDLWLLETA
jgi:hypothetical protein